MLKLSHVAIATPRIESVMEKLRVLQLRLKETHEVPTEKVRAAMVTVDVSESFRIELLEPTHPDSPIAGFLKKRPAGGLHHLCFEVTDVERWQEVAKKSGMEILPPGIRRAARGRAFFIHPRSIGGVLVELEELSPKGT